MDSLKSLLKLHTPEKLPTYQFQELALKIIKEFEAVDTERASVFKLCRDHYELALKAYNDCKELRKPFILYWFSLMNNQ